MVFLDGDDTPCLLDVLHWVPLAGASEFGCRADLIQASHGSTRGLTDSCEIHDQRILMFCVFAFCSPVQRSHHTFYSGKQGYCSKSRSRHLFFCRHHQARRRVHRLLCTTRMAGLRLAAVSGPGNRSSLL